ncbi:MAG: DUF2085 domain-containing protein [Verrucomicrobia bacterium]|nr:DUF2085 domain-containing protein [Verrucomicrobiota bacterium]
MAIWQQVFGFVCGQNPAHAWAPGGEMLPLCQRCTGLYAGAAAALLLQLALRLRPGPRFLQTHGLFLLAMIPLGFRGMPDGPLVRTLSGLLYGFGVVSFLWLLPGERLPAAGVSPRRKLGIYTAGVGGTLLAVPALAAWGGRGAGVVLTAMALAGLAGLGALMLVNLAIGLAWLVSRGGPNRPRPAP